MGRKWTRKRKVEIKKRKAEREAAGLSPTREKALGGGKAYVPAIQSNPKMEAYYAYQQLHGTRYDVESDKFVDCTTAEEMEEERRRWMDSLRSILPASFRIGRGMDETLRTKLEEELKGHVGKEMEIWVDKEEGRGFNKPKKKSEEAEAGGDEEEENGVSASKQAPHVADDAVATDESPPAPNLILKKVHPVLPISYVNCAYQLPLDRRTIRRNPALTEFHEWLKAQTASGFVTRQETVSMIPPVVLDVRRGHKVLDMCAAPGSKTCQLLEMVGTVDDGGTGEPGGFVVANDSDLKRAYMLVTQLRRLNSPAVFTTSCDAQFFPALDKGRDRDAGEEGMFDRVLCDVPCSGDGTTRKNPGMWKHWNQLGALALHPLQLGIALNGARLTKVGGYMCYSTCSMNPVENEAVVAELLRASDGALELVDRRPDLPGLLARPGWTAWKVMREERTKTRKEMKNFKKKNSPKMVKMRKEWEEKRQRGEADPKKEKADSCVDGSEKEDETKSGGGNKDGDNDKPKVVDLGPPPFWDSDTLLSRARSVGLIPCPSYESVPEEWRKRVRVTCFPPTAEEVATFNLERCMRCLPHDMNTGGFFVALLKKVKPLGAKARREAEELAKEEREGGEEEEAVGGDEEGGLPQAKRAKIKGGDGVCSNEIGRNENANDVVMDSSSQKAELVGQAELFRAEEKGSVDSEECYASNLAPQNKEEPDDTTKIGDDDKANSTAEKVKLPPYHGRGRPKGGDVGRENFVPVSPDLIQPVLNFYGLSSTFPQDQYMARANGDAKVWYFITSAIKQNIIDRGLQNKLTVVNSGLKAFERNNKACAVNYRLTQEGVQFVVPHMTKRKVIANGEDFERCIGSGTIQLNTFTSKFAAQVKQLDAGAFVTALRGYENDTRKKMFLVMWKCRGEAVNCLVAKVEMDGMKSKLRALGEHKQRGSIVDDVPMAEGTTSEE